MMNVNIYIYVPMYSIIKVFCYFMINHIVHGVRFFTAIFDEKY